MHTLRGKVVMGQRRWYRTVLAAVTACLLGLSPAHLVGEQLSLQAFLKSRQVVVGYADFAPFTYQNNRGEAVGEFNEVTRKVIEEAGYQPEFVLLPPNRLLLHLRTGAVDLAPFASRTPSLLNSVLES